MMRYDRLLFISSIVILSVVVVIVNASHSQVYHYLDEILTRNGQPISPDGEKIAANVINWSSLGACPTGSFVSGFDASGKVCSSIPAGTSGIDGSGTSNFLAKWDDPDTLTSSSVREDSSGNLILNGGTVTIDASGDVSTGLNADKLDGYDAADLLAAGGTTGGSMPLQGVIIFKDDGSNAGISTIPLSLPKAGCNVKITVCDFGANPPTKLIIGADPVPRITKSRNDMNPSDIVNALRSPSCGAPGCVPSGAEICFKIEDPSFFGYLYIYCPSGYYCDGSFTTNIGERYWCCPNGYVALNGKCYKCPSDYPKFDKEDKVCYKTPRCPPTEAGEVFIQEDDVDNVCVYCPADHPIYDATTKHCIREAIYSTTKVGNCATLSATLESAFTDITFADSNNQPVTTGDYVALAYSCPA